MSQNENSQPNSEVPISPGQGSQETNTGTPNSRFARGVKCPEPLSENAFYGIAGEIVRTIEPETESDRAALLIQFLVAFGNCIGRTAHFKVEGVQHFCNTFAVLIGKSSKGRKGTSWAHIRNLYKAASPKWEEECIAMGGLSSGQGLIAKVSDPTPKDEGVSDKRLLVVESEFASVLKALKCEHNILSPILRDSWDSPQVLQTLTRRNSLRATNPHISIIAHITMDDLRRYLSPTEISNGFSNRFLWLEVNRSKVLPNGGRDLTRDLEPFVERLKRVIKKAQKMGELKRDEKANELWASVYEELSSGKPGLYGSLTGRAEAQVMRFATIYALLDSSNVIRHEHLVASLSLWSYAEESVLHVFGNSTGNPAADKILDALISSKDGMTRTQMSDELFNHHKSARDITTALNLLYEYKLAKRIEIKNGKSTVERWIAITDDNNFTK